MQDAIDVLNTLQTPFAVIEARRKAGIKPDQSSITEIKAYWARLGHTVRSLFISFHIGLCYMSPS